MYMFLEVFGDRVPLLFLSHMTKRCGHLSWDIECSQYTFDTTEMIVYPIGMFVDSVVESIIDLMNVGVIDIHNLHDVTPCKKEWGIHIKIIVMIQ